MVRGEISLLNKDFSKNVIANGYIKGIIGEGERQSQNEEIKNKLSEYPSNAWVLTNVIFKEDISLKELSDIINDKENAITITYAAIATSKYKQQTLPPTGFNPRPSGIVFYQESTIMQEYPYLQIFNHGEEIDKDPEKVYSEHVKDLLKYMKTRRKFLNIVGASKSYEEELEYIENNGCKVYSILFEGNQQDVLNFIESNKNIDGIYINDIKPFRPFF